MANIIRIEAETCSRCPCLRNNQFGCYCFLTEEELHDRDINYEIGSRCPGKEEIQATQYIETDDNKIIIPLNNGGIIIDKIKEEVIYHHD